MRKLDRRQLLKAAALAAAGTAAAATGVVPALAATPSPPAGPGRTVTPGPRATLTNTPGTTYKVYRGLGDFLPGTSASGWSTFSGTDLLGATGVSGGYSAKLDVPQGATLTEVTVMFVKNDGGFPSFFLFKVSPADDSGTTLGVLFFGGSAMPSVQIVNISFPPEIVDNSQYVYVLAYAPGTSNTIAQRLSGARVGWILNPGLTTFPAPSRVFGNYTYTPADTIVTGIDATQKISGGGASGVPVGAKAAFCAVMSYESGTLGLYPDGTPANQTNVGNWGQQGTAGTGVQMTYLLVPLNAQGKFLIHNFFTAKRIFVDAWGYLV